MCLAIGLHLKQHGSQAWPPQLALQLSVILDTQHEWHVANPDTEHAPMHWLQLVCVPPHPSNPGWV